MICFRFFSLFVFGGGLIFWLASSLESLRSENPEKDEQNGKKQPFEDVSPTKDGDLCDFHLAISLLEGTFIGGRIYPFITS